MTQGPPPIPPTVPVQGPQPSLGSHGPMPVAYAVPVRSTAWPKVLGIISIVFAGLGLLSVPVNLFNVNANPVQKQVYDALPAWVTTYVNLSLIFSLPIVAVLLAGGTQTLRRKRLGRTLHLIYGWLQAVGGIVGLVIFFQIDTSGLAPAQQSAFLGFGLCGGLAGMVYPIFLLAWFHRAKIRDETAGWQP